MEYKKIVFFILINIFFSGFIVGNEEYLREQVRRALSFHSDKNPKKIICDTLESFNHLAPNIIQFSYTHHLETHHYKKIKHKPFNTFIWVSVTNND